jgi:hypothetical protein
VAHRAGKDELTSATGTAGCGERSDIYLVAAFIADGGTEEC